MKPRKCLSTDAVGAAECSGVRPQSNRENRTSRLLSYHNVPPPEMATCACHTTSEGSCVHSANQFLNDLHSSQMGTGILEPSPENEVFRKRRRTLAARSAASNFGISRLGESTESDARGRTPPGHLGGRLMDPAPNFISLRHRPEAQAKAVSENGAYLPRGGIFLSPQLRSMLFHEDCPSTVVQPVKSFSQRTCPSPKTQER
jgi:hypothetical protein